MTINPNIRDQAYQFFIEEAPELLQVIEVGLLSLRQERSTAKVHNLMRAAHSIKGGAATVGLEAIKTLAHRLENIFTALYSQALLLDTDLESQLLQAYDCLRLPLMEQIAVGHFDTEPALALADLIFAQIEQRLGDAFTQVDSYIPSSADLGIDMVKSIFEVDVAQGLERLAAVVAHPQDYEVVGELRAQAEVFTGFAELLNLPEFGAIARTTIVALDAHPNRALEITQLALADFQQSRQAVLRGDRRVSPSATLVALASIQEEGEQGRLHPSNSDIYFPPHSLTDTPSEADTDASHPTVMDVELVSEVSVTEEELFSLQEVFGSFITKSEMGVWSGLETPDSQAPITDIPEIEVVVQSIEQVFDSLPPIKEVPTPTTQLAPTTEEDLHLPAVVDADQSVPGHLVLSESSQLAQYTDTNSTDNEFTQVSALIRQGEVPFAPNLTVRVDSDRLGRMNNLVGELAINRNGLSLQNEQLQGAVRGLLDRFAKFQNIVGQLQELSDQSLVARQSYGDQILSHSVSQLFQLVTRQAGDFDSLEMDSYGALHSTIQEILEEMVQMEEAVDDIALFALTSDQKLGQQGQMLTQLRDEIMWARMLPVGEVLHRFPRVLRDLSTIYHKPVSLKLSGTGVLVEKAVLEKLYDPLLHLLRNAFDHGIEPPGIRRQLGKPEQGKIEIRAYHKGSQTIIEVSDDGQGLNLERIRNRALELDYLSVEQLSATSNDRLFEVIFEPGFSTANSVSELSGRGVGLDVVRSQLRSLKGTVTVTSSPGVGTTFRLNLPLSLSIAKLLVCLVGSVGLALPADSIEEIVMPTSQTQQLGTQRFLQWHQTLIPAYRLADLLDYACPLPETPPSKLLVAAPSPKDWAAPMLILRWGQQAFALEIDSLVTEQELTIKPFGTAIAPPSYTYGCTILGDGTLIPVVDGNALLERVLGQSTTTTLKTNEMLATVTHTNSLDKTTAAIKTLVGAGLIGSTRSRTINKKLVPTILVVDDAVTLRRTLALTLEKAGFRVLQARDGREAIEQLQQSSSVQLAICDIEMPNMNGFEFLNYRRQDPQLSKIPVAILTSRSNEKHRWLAMQLGATAYFTKPYVEQGFLKAIKDIIKN